MVINFDGLRLKPKLGWVGASSVGSVSTDRLAVGFSVMRRLSSITGRGDSLTLIGHCTTPWQPAYLIIDCARCFMFPISPVGFASSGGGEDMG